MDANTDVAPSDRYTTSSIQEALGTALAECPGLLLWDELRQVLPPETAATVFDAAADVAYSART